MNSINKKLKSHATTNIHSSKHYLKQFLKFIPMHQFNYYYKF